MKKYDVYKVEDLVSARGTTYKKLILKGEGDKFPIERVTMWNSHPLFEDIAAGQNVELEVEEKDSTTKNPHGGFYKNRTVLNPDQKPRTTSVTVSASTPQKPHGDVALETHNKLNLSIEPRLKKVETEVQALKDRLDVFIDEEGIQPKFNKPKDVADEDGVPF